MGSGMCQQECETEGRDRLIQGGGASCIDIWQLQSVQGGETGETSLSNKYRIGDNGKKQVVLVSRLVTQTLHRPVGGCQASRDGGWVQSPERIIGLIVCVCRSKGVRRLLLPVPITDQQNNNGYKTTVCETCEASPGQLGHGGEGMSEAVASGPFLV